MMAAYLAAHVDEGPLRWANLPPAWLLTLLIVVGFTSADIAVQALRVGASDFLLRPLTEADVADKLSTVFKERQLKHGDRAVLVGVITGTELRHLEGADADPVKVFAVLGQTAIADVHGELAIGLLLDQLGQLVHVLSKGAALAPE